MGRRALLLVALVIGAAVVAVAADWWVAVPLDAPKRYVGRNTCVECHEGQARQFAGSHHDLAMDHATPETVLGDFEDQSITVHGVTSRMFRRDGKFFINTDGPDGELADFEVKYTFGVHPLQQYLVELDGGRVQALQIAWDTERKEWFHLHADEKLTPDDPLHWTGPNFNWNYMCAECHSTNVEKNYDLASDTYHTTYSEIDVSCEACHGPGSLHVELARSKSLFWDRNHGYGLACVSGQSQQDEIKVCAECHARRHAIYPGYDPGDEFLDHYIPELLDTPVYHVDGQIDDESFEYTSFRQSLMHAKGVRCTDCHNPHTARLKAEGNNLCTQCHVPGKFDNPSHHHHSPGTPGASCVACHMPQTTYMVVDPRRDHSIRIPRPDLTLELGVPNACDACHEDKGAEWAAKAIEGWVGPRPKKDKHYAFAIKAGRAGEPGADEDLAKIARRHDLDGVVRASAVSLLDRYLTSQARDAIDRALDDDDPLVRYGGLRALEARSINDKRRLATPLLSDSVRSVRLEAARVLSAVPRGDLDPNVRDVFDRALAEWIEGQKLNADRAAAHLNLGVVYANQQQFLQAEESYRTAIKLEPDFIPAYNNLAMLLAEQGRVDEAESLFREMIRIAPDMAEAHYSLALLLAEQPGRLNEAAEELAETTRLAPQHARAWYNRGLALWRIGKHAEAEEALAQASRLEPSNLDFHQALLSFHIERKDWPKARASAETLARLSARFYETPAMVERLAKEASGKPAE